MLAKRIIPCLDIRDGQTVKGINFTALRQVGDPVELGAKYAAEGADELVYLDISASEEGRRTFTGLVSRIAARIDIPFTVGGGIASAEDAARLLDAGADKVSLNSAAVTNPALIDLLAARYGSQFVVAAIDARKTGERWQVTTHGGKRATERELFGMGPGGRRPGRRRDSLHLDGPRRHAERLSVRPVRPTGRTAGPGHRLGRRGMRRAYRRRADARQSRRGAGSQHLPLREIPIPVLKRELRKMNINVRL